MLLALLDLDLGSRLVHDVADGVAALPDHFTGLFVQNKKSDTGGVVHGRPPSMHGAHGGPAAHGPTAPSKSSSNNVGLFQNVVGQVVLEGTIWILRILYSM